MKKLFSALALLAVTGGVASAQDGMIRPEIRPFVGASIPTGTQRDLFNDAPLYGLQAALEIRPSFHLLGTFGYVPGQATFLNARDDVQILDYNVGVEFNMVRQLGASWLFKPFLGVGAGARTYLYDAATLKNRTCTAGYGALGTEFQLGRAAIRLEGRDNVFCYKSPLPRVKSQTRNDVGLSAGLAYHFR
ncbi:MAG TPA: hypothetical protein VFZ73_20070 [Gemmatimonadaceae bacterium]